MEQDTNAGAEAEVCARALALVKSHFEHLDAGNLAAAKAQLFSPAGVDTKPLDIYVSTMAQLRPFQLQALTVKRYEAPRAKRHGTVAAVWVNVDVVFALGRRTVDIVVWWLPETGECLISARPSEWVLEKLRGASAR
jgi:hypothetical protein